MNHHHIKIHPEHYNNVKAGTKTFEIRKSDRPYQKGDIVTLNEYNPEKTRNFVDEYHGSGYYEEKTIGYSGEKITFKIGDVYPIDADRVVFSLLKVEE